MSFVLWLARVATALGLYVLARWLFEVGSVQTDLRTASMWAHTLRAWPAALQRQCWRAWLFLREAVGLTQMQLLQLKVAIEEGHYVDDAC
jgi:hypothetical protein